MQGTTKPKEELLEDLDDIWQKVSKLELSRSINTKLQKALEGIIEIIGRMIEFRDRYTYIHQKEVSELAVKIATKMNLSADTIECIRIAALLHDIGKIAVPIEILSKPGRINDFEKHIIEAHPQIGHDIIEGIEFPWPIAEIILQHHERLDGSGYPKGISGDEIRLEARILAIADVFNAMISHRPYREAFNITHALEYITQNKGTFFDPSIVDRCVELYTSEEEEFLSEYSIKAQQSLVETLQSMAEIVEMRDPYIIGHQRRVTDLCCAIAKKLKLPESSIDTLRIAAAVHDIGMINVPVEVLAKPSGLAKNEYDLIRNHPKTGYEILKSIQFQGPIADIVLQHHERLDGSGYPFSLSANNLLPESKILAIADVVEAMYSQRSYRPPLGLDKAFEEISKNKGILYDPDSVEACINIFNQNVFQFT